MGLSKFSLLCLLIATTNADQAIAANSVTQNVPLALRSCNFGGSSSAKRLQALLASVAPDVRSEDLSCSSSPSRLLQTQIGELQGEARKMLARFPADSGAAELALNRNNDSQSILAQSLYQENVNRLALSYALQIAQYPAITEGEDLVYSKQWTRIARFACNDNCPPGVENKILSFLSPFESTLYDERVKVLKQIKKQQYARDRINNKIEKVDQDVQKMLSLCRPPSVSIPYSRAADSPRPYDCSGAKNAWTRYQHDYESLVTEVGAVYFADDSLRAKIGSEIDFGNLGNVALEHAFYFNAHGTSDDMVPAKLEDSDLHGARTRAKQTLQSIAQRLADLRGGCSEQLTPGSRELVMRASCGADFLAFNPFVSLQFMSDHPEYEESVCNGFRGLLTGERGTEMFALFSAALGLAVTGEWLVGGIYATAGGLASRTLMTTGVADMYLQKLSDIFAKTQKVDQLTSMVYGSGNMQVFQGTLPALLAAKGDLKGAKILLGVSVLAFPAAQVLRRIPGIDPVLNPMFFSRLKQVYGTSY